MKQLRVLSPTAILGYGFPLESFVEGMKRKPHVIAVDAGSTDPGPYYLGSGTGFVKAMQIKRDLEPALLASCQKKIPLIIGSAGGAGAQPHVDSFLTILQSIAAEHDLHFRLAVIYADLDQQLAEAKSHADIAKYRLNVAMGIGGDATYTLSSPLEAGDPTSLPNVAAESSKKPQ